MAFHGGALERATDAIAAAAAARCGASLYAVEQPPSLRWHIPSHRVHGSERLASFLAHVDVVIAVHGWGTVRTEPPILIGGRDRALASQLGTHLRARLPGPRVVDDLDEIPANLRGLHPRNPVNLVRDGGVQLELPPRVRGLGFARDTAAKERLVGVLASFAAGVSSRR